MSLIKPYYHVGIVVADVEESKRHLSELLGVSWADPMTGIAEHQLLEGRIVPHVGTGDRPAQGTVYSIDGPPYLELIQQRPGTVWEETGLHHLGVWTDDVAGESDRLASMRCPLEAVAAVEADGTWIAGCYHKTADNIRIEIVDIGVSGPKLARYLSGGEYR